MMPSGLKKVTALVSVTRTLPSVMVGDEKAKVAVPVALPLGVWAAVLSQVAVAVLVPLAELGAKRSEEHTSELQSHSDVVFRFLLEKTVQVPPLSTASVMVAVI